MGSTKFTFERTQLVFFPKEIDGTKPVLALTSLSGPCSDRLALRLGSLPGTAGNADLNRSPSAQPKACFKDGTCEKGFSHETSYRNCTPGTPSLTLPRKLRWPVPRVWVLSLRICLLALV